MAMYSLISFWIYVPLVWVIIGIIAILLELTDGSRVFFLPIGLGCHGGGRPSATGFHQFCQPCTVT